MRDSNWSLYYDNKHISKNGIRKFAANLKVGLRAAYGIKSKYNNTQLDTTQANRVPNHNRAFGNMNNNETKNQYVDHRLMKVAGYQSNEHEDLKSKLIEKITNMLKQL